MFLGRLIFLVGILIVCSGCGRFSSGDIENFNPFEKPTSIADFDYDSDFEVTAMSRVQRRRDCFINEFSLASTYPQLAGRKFSVQGRHYLPRRAEGPSPVVILFSPVGGINTLDEDMAKTLCSHKIAVFIPTTDLTGLEQEDVPPVEDHNHALYRVVSFTKAVVQYAKSESALESDSIGVMGASLGGILSSFAMSVIPEISAGYFIVAGGDMSSILAHSEQKRVRRVKQDRFRQYGFRSDFEYESWLRTKLSYDAMDFAATMPPESIRMVVALKDDSVPTENQWLLHRAFGSPTVRTENTSHIWAILKTLHAESDREGIAEFFLDRFDLENTRFDLMGIRSLLPATVQSFL